MGWNIGLAVIDGVAPDSVVDALDLVTAEREGGAGTVPLSDAVGIAYRDDHYAVGRLGSSTVVTAPWVPDHDEVWSRLSAKGRVLAILFSENHGTNFVAIYERGKRTVRREQGVGGAWKPKHRLEKGIPAGTCEADFVAQVFRAMTGQGLTTTDVVDVPLALHTRRLPVVVPDPAAAAAVREKLDAALNEPLPEPGPWVGLQWLNRRNAILTCLTDGWPHDPGAVLSWVPRVLADAERWPDREKALDHARFERIGKGEGTALDVAIAPMFRRFRLNKKSGVEDRYVPRAYGRFLAHPVAGALRLLDLGHTGLPTEAVVAVAGAERLSGLRALSLACTRAGDAGVAAVARSTPLSRLEILDLYACSLQSTAPLHGATFRASLQALSIGGNALGETVLRWLSAEPLPALSTLALRHDATVTEAAVAAFLSSPSLPGLRVLDLYGTAIDAAGGERLSALRPGLVVHTAWTDGVFD